MRQLAWFAIAGIAGFLADVGMLYLTLAVGLGYFLGRAMSFLCAVWITWQINRHLTFSVARRQSAWQEWWRYMLAMSGGGIVNYATYSAVLLALRGHVLLPLYAVAAGSVAGMAVNFATAKWWVFKHR